MKYLIGSGFAECPDHFGGKAWAHFFRAVMHDRLTGVEQLKHDGTTTVYLASYQGTPLVVKRYNTKNTWHLVRRSFRRSRADICYHMAAHYRAAGISTPAPIAQIQSRIGPIKMRSWFLSEFLAGTLFDEAIRQLGDAPPGEAMRTATCVLFEKLYAHRLSHGDLKAANLIWRDGEVHMLDLDAARHHRSKAAHRRALKKDLLRFLENWPASSDTHAAFKTTLTPLLSRLG